MLRRVETASTTIAFIAYRVHPHVDALRDLALRVLISAGARQLSVKCRG